MGHRTLCLDADVGLRNLDLYLGLADRAAMDFSDVLSGGCDLEDAVVAHPLIRNLFLLAAPMSLTPSDIDPEAMGELMNEIRERFDYCLIDCPAGLELGFRLAVAHADRAVIVATNDMSSLRDAQRTAIALRERGISQVRMVINRVRPKLLRRLHTTIDDAMDCAGLPLLGIVPEDEAVILATNRGEPVIHNRRKGSAQAYANIARRLTGQSIPLMKIK